MKDKIGRLAKGIVDIEAPAIEITPASVSDTFISGRDNAFIIEFLSNNGFGMKGICFSDDPRIHADSSSFSGRRVHVTFRIQSEGMKAGEVLDGALSFVTNGGEFQIPYHLECAGESAAEEISAAGDFLLDNPLVLQTSRTKRQDYVDEEAAEYIQQLSLHLPEDEELFEAVLSALIRSENVSGFAFAYFREAIRRGINITKLYESYVHAYPEGSEEPMPREVLLYFSYENDPDRSILRKLYHNIIRYVDKDSEIYAEYESAISHYAMSCALDRLIGDELTAVYDRMIYPGMIDYKAALVLPDIFKCRKISANIGNPDYLIVRYPELRTAFRAWMQDGAAFVPVYFKNAEIRFFNSAEEDITETVMYSSEEVFTRSDIIRRCFELAPEHEMLLLSAVREISVRGIASDSDKEIVMRAMKELSLTDSFRNELVTVLCAYEGEPDWISILRREDFKAAGSRLFGILVEHGQLGKAGELLSLCGYDHVSMQDLQQFCSQSIVNGMYVNAEGKTSRIFVNMCKYLFDAESTDEVILDFLTREYEGASEEMFKLLQGALLKGAAVHELPEKILSVKLYADKREHLDETFEAYIETGKYTDLLLRAYFTVRCNESFLGDEGKAEPVLYEALNSYIKAVENPLNLPLIFQLAITKHYSEMDELSEKELEICQKLTDSLIEQGLIFCYTKKLRKKIRIPEDICRRFYVEYHASTEAAPKMLSRVVPDEEEYHVTDMQRIYKNIYTMSTVLFKGDELQYVIYDNAFAEEASAEGMITVKKYHKQNDELFVSLNTMAKAIEEKDIELLRENMVKYVENAEIKKALFDLEF